MTSKETKAKADGIQIGMRDDFRCPCPQCSPDRRKKREPCLHVTVKPDVILAHCHHCNWSAAYHDDPDGTSGSAWNRRGAGHAPRPRERTARWW